MAYAATAEILDGAKFFKYSNGDAGTLRALVFETDAGKVTILWDRNEGYFQGQGKLIHKEPWLPSYTEKRSYKFHTTKSEVTVVDVIGRRQVVTATDGKVELELTGEPIFVYDIELPDITPILPLLLN